MANKRKPTKKRTPNQNAVTGKADQDKAAAVAQMILRPTVQAAATLKVYTESYCDLDLQAMIESLTCQTKAAMSGDLQRGEAMLVTQAHVLDNIFNKLAQRAISAEYMDRLDCYLKLALRAQSQCRSTWETLATIKNPPMMGYVKQANIAGGHQQVNNAPSTASDAPPARENENLQNKLLEEKDGERLDTGATSTTGRADPAMATLGDGDWAEDTDR